jgi:hypothetical protein
VPHIAEGLSMASSPLPDVVWLTLSVTLIGLLLFSLTWLILRESKKRSDADREVSLAQVALLDKMATLLSTKDPLAFQAVQAMGYPSQYDDFNPSVEAETARIHERDGERGSVEEELNAEERAALGDLFPGLAY